jgi:hypothetical protein
MQRTSNVVAAVSRALVLSGNYSIKASRSTSPGTIEPAPRYF